MDHRPSSQHGNAREQATPSVRRNTRELAERSSNGIRVRLLWRQGTKQLWVEVRERDDRMFTVPVQPERALDAFHHPYAFAGSHDFVDEVESLAARKPRAHSAESKSCEK